MNLKHFVLLLTIAAFYFSCNKGDNPGQYYEGPLPQEVKDYTYFKDSTYWVYQDSASGNIDSFFVFDSQNGFSNYVDNTGKPLAKLEVFQYFTKSSLDGFTYYYMTDLINNRYNDYPKVRILRVRENNGANILNHFFYHPIEVGKEYSYGPSSKISKLKLLANAPSLTFKQTFNNVLVYEDGANSTQSDNPTVFYVAKNIGIIRKEIPATGRVWNLVRYRIVQ